MSFINSSLLIGLAAISIPIILHLLNRRTAKVIDWGAMQFLLDSVQQRKKRIQLEEALLLAARCLLVALLAMAVARPFQAPGGSIPYVVILPAFLIALVAITTGLVLRENRRWFWTLVGGGLLLLIFSGLAVAYERYWNLKRYGTAGRKDIVLIIDGSTSMQIKQGGVSNFDRAIQEAREVIAKSSGGNAYSIILGGPVPMVKVGDPIVNKNDLELVLNSLKPVRGKMDAFAALSTSLTALNRGANPNKEIIVFTDQQNLGWNLESRSAWEALKGSTEQLTSKPPLICRQFPLPATFRNVAVGQLRLARDVVGTDRPVAVELTMENTGTEAISPASVELTLQAPAKKPAEGSNPATPAAAAEPIVLKEVKLGQLQPGGRETVRFTHKFTEPGSYVIQGRINVQDDLLLDDSSEIVAHVTDRLNVLVVEGNPGADILRRAASFTALALAPATSLTEKKDNPDPNAAKAEKSKPGVLLDPRVVPHTRLLAMESFAEYDVVVLCDVPKLADSVARRLGAWVQSGGGLLVAPGAGTDPAFYNAWKNSEGELMLPGKLRGEKVLDSAKEPLALALNTFTHAALRLVADAKQSDLGGTVIQRYWQLDLDSPEARGSFVGGRLANGDAFLTGRKNGFGVVLLTSTGFDTGGGNLATRQAFVPLMHQLVYHLSSPEGQPLQRQPALQVNLPLNSTMAEGGLRGEYFDNDGFKGSPAFVRIDSKTSANFGDGSPGNGVGKDRFSVRWSGALIPPHTDEYQFSGWADNGFDVWLDGKQIMENGGEPRVALQAGKPYDLRIDYREKDGPASYDFQWRTKDNKFIPERRTISSAFLMPFSPNSAEKEAAVGRFEAIGPDNAPRTAQLVFTRSGLVARLTKDIIPGVYRIQVPKDRREEYQRLLAPDGTIPFSITDDSTESRLTPFSAEDTEFIRSYIEFLQPKSAEEITNILAGREFGEELWKYLAVGALFILLAEIALTRWIALNRRSGEAITLDFENKFQAPQQFQDQLKKIQGSTA